MQCHFIPREKIVDLLKGKIGGFRVEEIDQWNKGGVEHAKIDVSVVLDRLDRDWRDFDHQEGENPV